MSPEFKEVTISGKYKSGDNFKAAVWIWSPRVSMQMKCRDPQLGALRKCSDIHAYSVPLVAVNRLIIIRRFKHHKSIISQVWKSVVQHGS